MAWLSHSTRRISNSIYRYSSRKLISVLFQKEKDVLSDVLGKWGPYSPWLNRFVASFGSRAPDAVVQRPWRKNLPEDQDRFRRSNDAPWKREFDSLLAARDAKGCYNVLQSRCKIYNGRKISLFVSGAFADALQNFPPSVGLGFYKLAKEYQVIPTPKFAVNVIKVLSRLDMVDKIEETVSEMFEMGLIPHWSVYFHWASAHADVAQPEGVDLALEACKAANQPVTQHYVSLSMKAYCKQGQVNKVAEILEEQIKNGIVPEEPVWRSLIYCYGRNGKGQLSAAVFDRMVSYGVTPSIATWSALTNAYAESNMLQEALETVRRMQEHGITPNSQTHTALIKAFVASKDGAAALGALTNMIENGLEPTKHTWGVVISACAASKDPERAKQVLQMMKKSGQTPGLIHYSSLMSAHRMAGDVEGGLQVWQELQDVGLEPNQKLLTELMSLYGKGGMVDEAEDTFDMIKKRFRPDTVAYNVLIGILMDTWALLPESARDHSPELQRAKELFDEAYENGSLHFKKEYLAHKNALICDFHYLGTWTVQFAVLRLLDEIRLSVFPDDNATSKTSESYSNCWKQKENNSNMMKRKKFKMVMDDKISSVIVITGKGIRRGWSPLRVVVLRQLQRMGFSGSVGHNPGTVVIPGHEIYEKWKKHPSNKNVSGYTVASWSWAFVDPKRVEAQYEE